MKFELDLRELDQAAATVSGRAPGQHAGVFEARPTQTKLRLFPDDPDVETFRNYAAWLASDSKRAGFGLLQVPHHGLKSFALQSEPEARVRDQTSIEGRTAVASAFDALSAFPEDPFEELSGAEIENASRDIIGNEVASFVGRVESLEGGQASVTLADEKGGQEFEAEVSVDTLSKHGIGEGDEFRFVVVEREDCTTGFFLRLPPREISQERLAQIAEQAKEIAL